MSGWQTFLSFVAAAVLQDDAACLLAGTLIASREASWIPAISGCIVGVCLGDMMMVAVGWLAGRRLLNWIASRRSDGAERIASAERWTAQRGMSVLFVARFLPSLRSVTQIVVGSLHQRPWRAIGWVAVASLLYAPGMVMGASLLGRSLRERFNLPPWSQAILILPLGLALLTGVRWLARRRAALHQQ